MRVLSPAEQVTALLLQHRDLIDEINDPGFLANLNMPGADLLEGLVKLLRQAPDYSEAQIIRHMENQLGAASGASIARISTFSSLINQNKPGQQLKDLLDLLVRHSLERELDELIHRQSHGGLEPKQTARLLELLQRRSSKSE